MLNLAGLKRTASKDGIPQAIVEKDYALSIALNAIAASGLAGHLIFKGGTALKKVYFSQARYSEDLDFTALNLTREQILAGLRTILDDKDIEGVRFEKVEEARTPAGLKAAVRFTGPLGQPQRIRLDFSFRDNLAAEPQRKPLLDTYGLSVHEILVLSLDELFAEKIHALLSRTAPRDLYDVWFLLGKNAAIKQNLVNKKFDYYDEKFDFDKLSGKIKEFETSWNEDLRQFLREVPPFRRIADEVLKGLKAAL
jgi:predicted nucleotidyltransferase component of viral defense system